MILDKVNFPLCLAPMVGLSHVAFRVSLRKYLPEGAVTLWPTEMLSSYKLPKQDIDEVELAKRADHETELVPQILGNDERAIRKSIRILKEWGAEAIDINMGCPVKKALKHNYGVSLMGDPSYAAEVTRMAVDSSDLPVSVKFRAGVQKDLGVLEEFAKGISEAGASWLILHPRTSGQKRRGRADWTQINHLKKTIDLPVFGNGDVQNVSDVFRMKEETGCDMVMVGRGFTARPWLLWQLGEKLGFDAPCGRRGESSPKTSFEEGKEFGVFLLDFIGELETYFDEEQALKRFKFHLRISHPWLEFGHELMKRSTRCHNLSDCRDLVERFFSSPQRMAESTLAAE